jgi:hypothetical protein
MAKENTTKINYDITAADAGASAAFVKLGKQMEMAAAKAQMMKDQAGFLGKELDKFAKIGGIALLGRGLASATEKAAELVEQFQSGQVSIQEMGKELLKTIPIIGEFAKAGENLRMIFDPNMRAAAADEARAKEDTKNIENRGKAQDNISKALKDARADYAKEIAAAGGDEGQKARDAARQEFEKNMAGADELEKGLRDTGQVSGKEFDRIAGLKRTYANIYSAALLAARVEDENARLKIEEDIRKKEQERQEKLQKEAQERAKKQEEAFHDSVALSEKMDEKLKERAEKRAKQAQDAENLRFKIVTEDRVEALELRKDTVEKRIERLKDTPLSRTAASFTDTGAGALLAAKQPKSDDPTVKALRESQVSLKSIDKEIKGLRTDSKTRERAQEYQEIFNTKIN